MAIYREVGDAEGIAARLRGLGSVACARGDFEKATPLLEESVAWNRQHGGPFSIALAIGALGLAMFYQEQADRAARLFEESLTLYRQLAHTYGVAWSLHYLGCVEQLRGNDGRALLCLTESLRMRRELEDSAGIAGCLEGVALVALAQRRHRRAARLLGAAETARATVGCRLAPAERDFYARKLATARPGRDEEGFPMAWAEGQALTLEQAVAYALQESSG
jgi:tetratricopeptide (TPR) repeat protein